MLKRIILKYEHISVQAKAALWFTICSILQKGVSFIVVPIFTRLLTDEQYGIYSLYLSWLQIFTIITSLYLYYGVFNNAMNKYEEDRDTYISSMQGLTLTVTSIVAIVCLMFKDYVLELTGLSSFLIILMFVELAVTPALSFWSGKQRFEYKYKRLVLVTILKTIANPVIGLIAVLISEDKATARIASVVLVEVMFCGTVMVLQFIRGKRIYHKKYWSYALKLALPLLPHYLSGMILNQGDRLMISKMVGLSEVAYYSVAYSIGMIVQIVTNAVSNSFTPWVYQKMKKEEYEAIPSTTNAILLFVFLISFLMMLCSPELVLIFGSKSYSSAIYVIPPVAASVYFIYLYNLLATPQFYFERTSFLMISSLIAAGINILLNYIFIGLSLIHISEPTRP